MERYMYFSIVSIEVQTKVYEAYSQQNSRPCRTFFTRCYHRCKYMYSWSTVIMYGVKKTQTKAMIKRKHDKRLIFITKKGMNIIPAFYV